MTETREEFSAALSDALDVGLIGLDGDRRVVAWNAWLTTASGISAEQANGRRLDELFPNLTTTRLSTAVSDALESGVSTILTHSLHPGLFPLKTRAGRALAHNTSVRPLGRNPGSGCLIQINDVTLAAHREALLRERQNARYHAVVDNAYDPIITIDSEGLMQLANPATSRGFGYTRQELIGMPITLLMEEQDAWNQVWRAVLGGEVLHRPVQLVGRRKDGSLTYLEVSASRWSNYSRLFVTAIFRDVNERRAAEEALRAGEERLRFALEAGRLGWWELDLTDWELSASAICKANFGRGAADHLSYGDLVASIHSKDRERQHKAVLKAIAARSVLDVEYRTVWPDGTVRWIYVRGQTSCGPDGTPDRMAGVSLDITERKQAEESRELLTRELDHRVKNILATVQAVASQTLPRGEVANALRGRIGALAEAQRVLAAGDWEKADLRVLIQTELAPYRSGNKQTRVAGPAVQLPASAAQTLALVLHELATNAAKYGALSVPDGFVDVKWEVRDEVLGPRLSLVWAEAGGPSVTLPTGKGFGSRLIHKSVTRGLGGNLRLKFQPDGLRCEIDIPI